MSKVSTVYGKFVNLFFFIILPLHDPWLQSNSGYYCFTCHLSLLGHNKIKKKIIITICISTFNKSFLLCLNPFENSKIGLTYTTGSRPKLQLGSWEMVGISAKSLTNTLSWKQLSLMDHPTCWRQTPGWNRYFDWDYQPASWWGSSLPSVW